MNAHTLYRELLTRALDPKQGGATFPLAGRPAGRYVVGGLRSFDVPAEFALTTATIDNAVRQLGRTAPINADTIGSWLDSETNRAWLDYGTVHESESEAYETARSGGELAFWDTAESREIRV